METMSAERRTRHRMARFPRLRQIREELLGWEVTQISERLPGGKPSISSIYRLEQGLAIRMANTRRVFDVVNKALGGSLDPQKEIDTGLTP
jgi:hypothetical protein